MAHRGLLVGAQTAQGDRQLLQRRQEDRFPFGRAAGASVETLRHHGQAFDQLADLPVVFPERVTKSRV